jgi:hypothetical protein
MVRFMVLSSSSGHEGILGTLRPLEETTRAQRQAKAALFWPTNYMMSPHPMSREISKHGASINRNRQVFPRRRSLVDEASEILLATCKVIPLQIFSYCKAIRNGINVDHPRNLNKAVLAE